MTRYITTALPVGCVYVFYVTQVSFKPIHVKYIIYASITAGHTWTFKSEGTNITHGKS